MKATLSTLFTIVIFFNLSSYSQTVSTATLNTTGGTHSLGYYQIEWSIGEAVAINTMTDNPNLVVTNGVLQPSANPAPGINYSTEWFTGDILIFPNPVRDILEIDFLSRDKGNVTMSLYTATGQLLANKQFDYHGIGRIEHWSLSKYPAGQYFIKIEMVPVAPGAKLKEGGYKIQKVH